MNRVLLLVCTLGLAAAGLSYVLLSGQGQEPPTDAPAETPTGLARKGSDVTAAVKPTVDTLPVVPEREAPVITDGILGAWEIVPMNALGQAQTNAAVTATYTDGTELTGTGQTTFNGVPYGKWTVVVTQEGEPEWRRELTIDSRTKRRMFVYIGKELRIAGEVVDTYGNPVGDVWVLFLPPGKFHPTTEDIKAAGGLARLPGVSHAKTTKTSGKFRARLPKPGKYRISIGSPGKARWTMRNPVEVTSGGLDYARIVVPAQASVALSFADGESLPTQVGAYIFDAERAARQAAAQSEEEPGGKGGRITDVGAAGKNVAADPKARERAMAEGRELGDSDHGNLPLPVREQNQRTFDRNMDEYGRGGKGDAGGGASRGPVRAPLFEPGWRPVRTGYPDKDGRVVLENLPDRESYKFLFVRGRERIATSGTFNLTPGRRNLGEVTLPDLSNEEGTVVQSTDVRVRVREDEDAAAQMIEAGVIWSFDPR